MRKRLFTFCLAAILLFTAMPVIHAAEITKPLSDFDFAAKCAEIIQTYDGNISTVKKQSQSAMLRLFGRVNNAECDFSVFQPCACAVSADGRFLLQFSTEEDLVKCLSTLERDKKIVYVMRDSLVFTQAETERDYLGYAPKTLGIDKISAYLSQQEYDNSVTVAVVDSGIKAGDFLNDKLVAGYDYVDNDGDATNDTSADSHGTFLGSLVADCTAGLPVNIMPVRVLASKSGSIINAVNGIYYAVDNGADIINMSLGGVMSNCQAVDEAVAYAESHGVCVVVCAGNTKSDIANYCPAHNESAVTVTAVDENNVFASEFSNFGEKVDCCAPGVNIVGYGANGQTKTMSGTSMSAAFVSAAMALLKLYNPSLNTVQLQSAIKTYCTDLGEKGADKYYGFGIPDLGVAVKDETIYVKGINVKQSQTELMAGETQRLETVIIPSNASNKKLYWQSDNETVAAIRQDGTVTARQAGECNITVTTDDGAYTAKCHVTVMHGCFTVKWTVRDITITQHQTEGSVLEPPEISAEGFIGWSETVPTIMPAENLVFFALFSTVQPSIFIENNSQYVGQKHPYKETVTYCATVNHPVNGGVVCWIVNDKAVATGEKYTVTKAEQDYTIQAQYRQGDLLLAESESVSVTVNTTFWAKMLCFIRNLFSITK